MLECQDCWPTSLHYSLSRVLGELYLGHKMAVRHHSRELVAPFAHYLVDGIPAPVQVQEVACGYDTICTLQYLAHRLPPSALHYQRSYFFSDSMRTEPPIFSIHAAKVYSTEAIAHLRSA